MKIVFHHPHPLPVVKYGGIERIIYWHMLELARLGHKVVLIGHPDSQVEKHGIELIPQKHFQDPIESQIPADTDLVHLFYNYQVQLDLPTLVTMQGNGVKGEKFPLNTVFVSRKHAANHGSDQFIYNALDLSEYPYQERQFSWEKFLFLAKGSWKVKNLKGCIKACKQARKELHIAGGRDIWPSRYTTSYGMVGGADKLNIIKNSDCLLFPVRWHEPFGIAIIEAQALGLPVIGGPYGSLPELISEKTGLIAHNQKELLALIQDPGRSFDPQAIRQHIEDNFAMARHTADYLAVYQRLLDGENLNSTNPSWQLDQVAVALLPY